MDQGEKTDILQSAPHDDGKGGDKVICLVPKNVHKSFLGAGDMLSD